MYAAAAAIVVVGCMYSSPYPERATCVLDPQNYKYMAMKVIRI